MHRPAAASPLKQQVTLGVPQQPRGIRNLSGNGTRSQLTALLNPEYSCLAIQAHKLNLKLHCKPKAQDKALGKDICSQIFRGKVEARKRSMTWPGSQQAELKELGPGFLPCRTLASLAKQAIVPEPQAPQ